MPRVQWNLRFIEINEAEATCLLAEDLIYDPGTPEYPSEGIYYPEDTNAGSSMDEIQARLDEYRADLI